MAAVFVWSYLCLHLNIWIWRLTSRMCFLWSVHWRKWSFIRQEIRKGGAVSFTLTELNSFQNLSESLLFNLLLCWLKSARQQMKCAQLCHRRATDPQPGTSRCQNPFRKFLIDLKDKSLVLCIKFKSFWRQRYRSRESMWSSLMQNRQKCCSFVSFLLDRHFWKSVLVQIYPKGELHRMFVMEGIFRTFSRFGYKGDEVITGTKENGILDFNIKI